MYTKFPLKTILEWSLFCLFIFLIFASFLTCYGSGEEGWQSVGMNVADSAENEDIAEKLETKPSRGVIWGKSNKTPVASEKTPAERMPQIPARETKTPPAVLPKTSATPQPLPQLPSAKNTANKTKYLLKSSRKKGSTDLVETLLEVTGDVKQVSADLKESKDKMEVTAGFRYEERISEFSLTDKLVGVRRYNMAKSRMKIGSRTKMPELESELQTIVCSLEKESVSLFSPRGSLRGEQLLLIEDIPGNTLTIDRLLPNKEVGIADTWKISDSVLRSFLSIDAVVSSNVEAVLTAVADNMAIIEVVGDVSGVYLGAATEMSVRAKFQFDLAEKRINWIGMMIEENRSIGHVGPGLDLLAKLQVKISPNTAPKELTDEFMMTVAVKPSSKVLQLKYDGGKGPWRFSHDRSWYVYQDDPQATVLRKLENGELIAQCNVADMGTVDVKTMTSLEKFQQDLITGLGKNFGKVAAATQYTDKRGYKVYKVLLDGTVENMPIRWIYHLLTDADGRQSVVVFVVEAAMLEQFGSADDLLLDTYRMGK
ncbi:MAG: hypothetical protein LBH00_00905 [Planctomycetaceae bacterium]|jgi:hypothetical protein|nr:hypothetical protein [Planctomycetaceae bacterium]